MPATTQTRRRPAKPSAVATRQRILDAALEVFAERSFDGAGTREIAARAGVTQPLLNYHFSSKNELWRAAVDELFAALRRALEERTAGLRGVDELTTCKLLIREFICFSARAPQLQQIITGECKSDGPRLQWLADEHVRPLFESTTAMFARLVEQGHLPPISPTHLYYILTGAGATIFVLGPECQRLTGLDPSSDEAVEAHADAVLALLFGPPRRGAEATSDVATHHARGGSG
jgi:TetR/AcrR family transcriptional regulator